MNKIMSFFNNNFIWKLAALVMAIILWILAVNIEDPQDNRSYHRIAVELKNTEVLDEYDLVLLNREEVEAATVTVTVWANTKLLQNQLSSSNIKAYIDMSPIRFSYMNRIDEPISAPVEITLPEYANTVRSYIPNPTNISIVLDKKEKRSFPVTVVKTSEPAEGYVSMTPVPSPSSVELTGASSILDTVQAVRVDVDLDEVTADYTVYKTLKVYDDNDVDITDKFNINTKDISVFVPINRHAQIPIVIPATTGLPPEGYTITGIESSVSYIDVVGKEDELAAVTSIRLDPIDVTNISETITVSRDVRDFLRSTNLSVRNGMPHEVDITLTIEREIVKEFSIPISMIEIIGEEHPDAEYGGSITLRLKGLETVMSELTADSIKCSINISVLSEGDNDARVIFELPDNVSLIGDEPVISVFIPPTDEESEETPQTSQDENPVETSTPETPLP